MVLKGWFIKRMMSDENIIKFGDFNYEGEEKNKSQIIQLNLGYGVKISC